MATSDVTNDVVPTSVSQSVDTGGEHVYAMSKQGKRQAVLILLGVVAIWTFALWTLVTIFQDGVTGVEWVSLLLMLGMLVVAPVVAWGLVEEANSRITINEKGITYRSIGGINLAYNWEDIEDFQGKEGRGRIARFFLGNDESTDKNENNKAQIAEAGEPRLEDNNTTGERSEREATADGEEEQEPETLLLRVRTDRTARIANPLVNFLHRLAHGSHLPIYGGLENQAQLVREIDEHATGQDFTPPRS